MALAAVVRKPKRSLVVSPFLDFPHRCPACPQPGEHGERPAVIEREPDIAAMGSVELAERGERHHAAMLDPEPALPMLAGDIADIGRPAIRLHPQQLLEIDDLALGLELSRPRLRGIEQRLLRGRHAPAHLHELAHAIRSRAHHRCREIREDARLWRQIAGGVPHRLRQLDDRRLTLWSRCRGCTWCETIADPPPTRKTSPILFPASLRRDTLSDSDRPRSSLKESRYTSVRWRHRWA